MSLIRPLARWGCSIAAIVSLSLPSSAADKKNDPEPPFHGPQPASEIIDLTMYARIREEGLRHSHVMQLAGALVDGIGPRLTGSPNMAKVNAWTRDTLTAMGLRNARLEDWGEFGFGWQQINTWVRMVTPDPEPLLAQAAPLVPGDQRSYLRTGDLHGLPRRGRPRKVQGQARRQDRSRWPHAPDARPHRAPL